MSILILGHSEVERSAHVNLPTQGLRRASDLVENRLLKGDVDPFRTPLLPLLSQRGISHDLLTIISSWGPAAMGARLVAIWLPAQGQPVLVARPCRTDSEVWVADDFTI